MKKLFKVMFFITLALVFIAVALMVASIIFTENSNADSIGIIGGADGPTAVFITQTLVFDNPIFWVLCFVAALLIASAIGWLITRKK